MQLKRISLSDFCLFFQENMLNKHNMILHKDGVYYAVFDNGKIISAAGYIESKKCFKIVGLFTKEKYRKKGICFILCEHILNLIGNKNVLFFATKHSKGIAEKLGFQVIKEYKTTYKMKRFSK